MCDWILLVLTIAVLTSGIQLEMLHGENREGMWIHVVICSLFMVLCGWHIWLHLKKSNWFSRFHKMKSRVTRVLWWVSIVTFLSGIIAVLHWISSSEHGPVGGVHGKLGFLMIALVVAHVVKRRKFYSR